MEIISIPLSALFSDGVIKQEAFTDSDISYSEEDMVVTLYDSDSKEQLVELELKSHKTINEKQIMNIGWNVLPNMWYEVRADSELKDVLGKVTFIDMNSGKEVEKEWYYVYGYEEIVEIPIYDYICKDEENQETCEEIFSHYVYENQTSWINYDSKDIPKGITKIGIRVYVEKGDWIDGIWNVGGVDIEKHAEWEYQNSYTGGQTSSGVTTAIVQNVVVTGGDLIVAFGHGDAQAVTNISDTQGNTYSNETAMSVTRGGWAIASSSGTINITITFGTATTWASRYGTVSIFNPNGGTVSIANSTKTTRSYTTFKETDTISATEDNVLAIAHFANNNGRTIDVLNISGITAQGTASAHTTGHQFWSIYDSGFNNRAYASVTASGWIELEFLLFEFVSESDITSPSYSNLIASPSSPTTYSPGTTHTFNSTWIDDTAVDTVIINFDSANSTVAIASGTAQNGVYRFTISNLAAGSYNYYWWANDTASPANTNQTGSQSYTINQNTGACDVLFNETSLITYPATFRVWTNCNSAAILYRNGSAITNDTEQILAAGTWNFTVIRTDTQNYSNVYDVEMFTINKAAGQVTLKLNDTEGNINLNYPGQVNASASTTTGQTITLLRNGTTVTGQNHQFQNLAAGYWNFTATAEENQNYTSATISRFATINKGTSSVYTYVNNTRSNINIETGSQIFLNATTITGDSGAILRLYRNSTMLNQGASPLSNFTLFDEPGVFNITGFYVESENYTGSFETWYVTVEAEPDTEAPTITIHSPQNITYNNATQLVNISAQDNVEVSRIWYNWNGTNITYTSTIYIEFNEGSNTLIVWANDTSGNTNSTNVTFTIDTIAPSCSIQSITEMTNASYQHVKDNTWFYNPSYIGSVRINISSLDVDVHSVIFPETVSAGAVYTSFPYLHDYNWTTTSTYNGTTTISINDTSGNIGNCTFEIYRDAISPSYLGYNYVGGASYIDENSYWVTGGDNYLIIINHSDAQSGVRQQYFGYNKDGCTPNGCGGQPYEIKSYVTNNVMTDWMANDSYLNIVSAVCQLPSCYDVLNASYLWNTTVSNDGEDWDYKMNTFLYDLVSRGAGYTDIGIWLKIDNTKPISTPSSTIESASENFNISVSDSDSRSGLNPSSCEYRIFNSTHYTLDWTSRICNSNVSVDVSYCSNGNNCTIVVRSTDNVGLVSEEENVSIFYEELDFTVPTYSNNQHNNTIIGIATLFSILWNDDVALHPDGQWIFSTNNTGTWVNDSAVNFTTTPSWANVTKTLNNTIGIVIGYRWYVTDNAGNPRETDTFVLTAIPIPLASPSRIYIGSGKLSLSSGGRLILR